MQEMNIPAAVSRVLDTLEAHGFEAYLVGGCVRDHQMGKTPHDFDLTTSAEPEEVMAAFDGCTVVPTGLQHGTVTVVIDKIPVEITTYRVDGDYADHRHPDEVRFTRSLKEDLARRDFTVNAMAYSPKRGLQDPFGGIGDLKCGILRCVGDPARRFDEDALRILRALRFSATLGFPIEEETAKQVHLLKDTLSHVSAERIYAEFCKLLTGKDAPRILTDYIDVIGVFIPELLPSVGFDQKNTNHSLDAYGHTVKVLSETPPVLSLRLAALFHDIEKPHLAKLFPDGQTRFPEHPLKSAETAVQVLTRLRSDKATMDLAARLIRYHDEKLRPERPMLRRILRVFSYEEMPLLFAIQRADAKGHNEAFCRERLERLKKVEAVVRELEQEQVPIFAKDLAVSGRDLMALGVPAGPALGQALNALLEEVTEERLPNEKEALLRFVKETI